MNRSILIVIIDFLLVSLLMFSNPDLSMVTGNENKSLAPQFTADPTNTVGSGNDLANAMRLALSEEQKKREELLAELSRSRETATSTEKQAQAARQELELKTREAARLADEQAALKKTQEDLQKQQLALLQQFSTAQTNLQKLNSQLQTSSTEALLSREKIEALEAERRKENEEAAALKKQLTALASSNQMVLNEKQQLSGKLQVAEVERRHALEQVGGLQEQVKVEREEKAKLAEGVKTLAVKSSELTQEVRENRPLAPN